MSRHINVYLLLPLLATLCLVYSPGVFSQEAGVKGDKYLLEPEDFKRSANKKNTVILDVRTPKEFTESRIPGAKNIDYKKEDFRSQVEKLDKNTKYFIYCRSGKRSANSRKIMNELGIKKVYDLKGGILAWEKQEYPIQ